jgi:membrane protein implicated in regulation of membrane protease activity
MRTPWPACTAGSARTSTPDCGLGRVQVGGDDWRAESISDAPLRTGDAIEVVRVESNTLIVKPLTNN